MLSAKFNDEHSPSHAHSSFPQQVLCALADGLKPGSIRDVSKGSNAFIQMQNIDKFLKTCVIVVTDAGVSGCDERCVCSGVNDGDGAAGLFETVDFYEEKDMTVVLEQQQHVR